MPVTYVCRDTGPLKLVDLVVKHDVLLVAPVQHGSLVNIAGSGVSDFTDDVGDVCLVGNIVDGHGVLVVGIADVTAGVAGVWATVDQALGIVDVAVSGGTAKGARLGRVGLMRVSLIFRREDIFLTIDLPYHKS
jgi:hypothetical protein